MNGVPAMDRIAAPADAPVEQIAQHIRRLTRVAHREIRMFQNACSH
jgi:hypothetical protein